MNQTGNVCSTCMVPLCQFEHWTSLQALFEPKNKFERWTGECIVSFQFEQHGTDANQLVLEQSLNTR